jgi:hypothetical protein
MFNLKVLLPITGTSVLTQSLVLFKEQWGGGEGEYIYKSLFFLIETYTHVFRYEITGLTEEHLRNSKSHKEVQDRILEILYNGESARRLMSDSGKARLLVGHDLKRGLDCLRINYPGHLLR